VTTARTNKPVMVELLVRRVFGDAAGFLQVCERRGITAEEAVTQALQDWIGGEVAVPTLPTLSLLATSSELTPDPGDCPVGQEEHWIQVCEHDLDVLRKTQQQCFRSKSPETPRVLDRTNRTIERYIQTLASLRDRVA
jgi:hypothetical protein